MNINEMILNEDDPFNAIYECIDGIHGREVYDYIMDMYNQVVIDYGYHPDDDFEEIIEKMIMIMEEDR